MSDAMKHRILRILIHTGGLFTLYVLQAMIFPHLRIFGVAPFLFPLAVVGVGLFEGPSWGGGFGLAAGLLCDIMFSNSVALFTIVLTATGMGIGLLSTYLLNRGFPSYILCVCVVLILITFFQKFTLLVYFQESPPALLRVAALQIAYSLLFAVPFYYLARAGRSKF